MKNTEYNPVEIELVYFDAKDVISTSDPIGGGNEGETTTWDKTGWT